MTVEPQDPTTAADAVHPGAGGATFPACRICHCTDQCACPAGCWWVDDPIGLGHLCSRCVAHALALAKINTALEAADKPLSARELATRTGIGFQELVGVATADSPSLLDELTACGHLQRSTYGTRKPATYVLSGGA